MSKKFKVAVELPELKITGGSPSSGKILTSDGSGNGSWQPISISPRINSTTSSATPSINTDTTDQFNITALATNITSMTTNLTGTPVDGQKLIIRIKDDNNARTISWGSSFQSQGAILPTTTIANKTMYIGLIYNSVDSKWSCIALSTEA